MTAPSPHWPLLGGWSRNPTYFLDLSGQCPLTQRAGMLLQCLSLRHPRQQTCQVWIRDFLDQRSQIAEMLYLCTCLVDAAGPPLAREDVTGHSCEWADIDRIAIEESLEYVESSADRGPFRHCTVLRLLVIGRSGEAEAGTRGLVALCRMPFACTCSRPHAAQSRSRIPGPSRT